MVVVAGQVVGDLAAVGEIEIRVGVVAICVVVGAEKKDSARQCKVFLNFPLALYFFAQVTPVVAYYPRSQFPQILQAEPSPLPCCISQCTAVLSTEYM